jgi:enoyl reductase-like protein
MAESDVSFKPGSVDGILQVSRHTVPFVNIPTFVLLVVQALVAHDIWPYITGDWSVEHGAQPMPFDGPLFAS